MQKNIREMVTTGVETKQLAVDHVRERRERVPIVPMPSSKCVDDAVNTQSMSDVRIGINIFAVVVVDEVVTDGLRKHQPGNGDQENTNAQGLAVCA